MNDLLERASSYYRAGRLGEAEGLCRQLLSEDPHSPAGHFLLGLCAFGASNFEAAAKSFARSVEINPSEPNYHVAFGELHKRKGDIEGAIGCFETALKLRESPIGYCSLADLYLREGDHSSVEQCARRALELDPQSGVAHELLGMAMEETGRFSEAIAEFEIGYQLQPEKTFILYRIARCKKMDATDQPFINRLEQLAASPQMKIEQVRYLEYALGKAHDDLGEFESALKHYERANVLSERIQFGGKRYPLGEFKARFEAVKQRFTKAFYQKHSGTIGSESDRPIFIVGMIRSGTTLMEQILSSHPDVAGGGEQPFWLSARGKDAIHEATAGRIDVPKLEGLIADYLRVLSKVSPTAPRVTDKMPNNYMALGLIHLLFPNARILHCRRNAVDNCLSIYTTLYSEPPKFAYNQENIVAAYRLYADLMEHWARVIPRDRLLTVDYEDLASNSEPTLRNILEFCGLPWNPACLNHEGNPRAVKTPSLWQVRQPLYTSSVERWRNYEPWLGAFRQLEGCAR